MKRSQWLLLTAMVLLVGPVLQAQTGPWSGIISSSRGIDWTQAGAVPGAPGTLPDASWTQCGSTVPAGTSAATITSDLAACAQNTYLLLGSGTFTISGQITFPTSGHVVLRGSGANSTHIVITGGSGCQNGSAAICVSSSDAPYFNEPVPNVCNWTAGYGQGSTAITLSNSAGNCPSALSTTKPTILWLEQCETGTTASSATANCTGNTTDNGQLFVCSPIWSSSGPTGCSSEGPDSQNNLRGQFEGHVVTAYNSGTGVATIAPPVIYPNWVSGQTPRAWIQQSITDVGVENLSIDNSANGTNDTIQFFGAYKYWVSGISLLNTDRWGIEQFECLNGTIMSNYIYGATGGDSDNMGIRTERAGNELFINNIIQNVFGPIVFDGPSSGDVIAYNFVTDVLSPNDWDKGAFIEHSVNSFELYEGNIANAQWDDGEHGSQDMVTRFRNFLTGWSSCANGQCGSDSFKDSGTNALNDFYAGRYINNVANVLGTPGYHTSYQCTSTGTATCVESVGPPSGGVTPYDPLVHATLLSWGNWDSVTNAVRWCGNSSDTGWSSACGGVSEVPTGASTYPNSLPTKGDTAIGQAALPQSFLFTSKPAWFGTSAWPSIGPDVTGGNIGQCSGTLNSLGKFAGVAAISSSQCTGTSLASAWGGHVNANPAMNCFLNVMGGKPDGTGGELTFNPSACYASGSGTTIPNAPSQLAAQVN